MSKSIDRLRGLGLRRLGQVAFLSLAVALVALVSAGNQASRAAIPPPNPLEQTFQGSFTIKIGTQTIVRDPVNITVTSIPSTPTGSPFNGYISRVQVNSVNGDPVQGDIQLDTAANGWSRLISRPSVFRLQVPSLEAAKVYVEDEWRILSSPPGGYAQITAGFTPDGQNLTVKSSGRIAFLLNGKINQFTFNLDVTPGTVLDAPPIVVGTFPAPNSVNQSAFTAPQFQMSEPVEADASAFTFECNDVDVPFTLGLAGNNATLTPNSPPLPPGAVCEVSVNMAEVTDADLNDPPDEGANTETFEFTVSKVVAVNDAFTVPMNAPATPLLVLANDTNPDNVPLSIASVTQPANGTVVLTPPAAGVKTGLTYKPKLNYCNTPPGSPLDTFTYTLNPGGTTATVAITIICDDPPAVTDVTISPPVDTGTTPPTTTTDPSFTFTFNEPVLISGPGAYTVTCNGNLVGSITGGDTPPFGGAGTSSITVTGLPEGANCVLTVLANQVSDADTIDPPDNMTANFTYAFQTDAPPTVQSTTPGEGEVVSTDVNILIAFSEPIQFSGESDFELSCGGFVQSFVVSSPPAPVVATTVVLTPAGSLPEGVTCTVEVGGTIKDNDSLDPPDDLVPYTFSFETDAAPSVVSVERLPNGSGPAVAIVEDEEIGTDDSLLVTFSEPVDVFSTDVTLSCGATFTLSGSGTDTLVIDFTDAELTSGADCTLTLLNSITDVDTADPPDTLSGGHFTFDFDVDEAPTVISTTVDGGSSSLSGDISITFSEAVMVSTASFDLECPDGTDFPFVLTTAGAQTTHTIDPTGDLPPGANCELRIIAAAVSDADDRDPPDQMTADVVLPFVTNQPPTALAQAGIVNEDPAAPLMFTFQSSDPDGDQTIAFTITTPPAHGNVVVGAGAISCNGATPNVCTQAWFYAPNANYNGPDSFEYTASDAVAGESAPATVSITVSSVNDAPAGADGSATILEDASHVFAVTDFGFTDLNDSPANTLEAVVITTLPTAGSLTFNGAAVVAGQAIPVNGDPSISNGDLIFAPAPDANGVAYATFTFQVRDDGGTNNGGIDTDPNPDLFTINVTPVNDEPTVTLGSDPVVSDSAGPQSVSNFAMADLGPPDEDATQAVDDFIVTILSVTEDDGTTPSAEDPFAVDPDIANDGTLTYTPTDVTQDLVVTISVQVRDNGGTANGGDDTSQAITFTITVRDNLPPTISCVPAPATTDEDTPVDLTCTIGDTETAPGNLVLTATSSDAALVANTPAGLAIDCTAAPSCVVTVTPVENANGGPIDITLSVEDEGGKTAIQFVGLTVAAVNDPPELDLHSPPGATFTEGQGSVALLGVLPSITDVDSVLMASATVTITNNLDGGFENLSAAPGQCPGISMVSGPTLTLTGNAPAGTYETCLQSVTYANIDEDPDGTQRVISWVVNDGTDDSIAATSNVNVVPVNDPPILTAGTLETDFTEDLGPVVVDSAMDILDFDSPNMRSLMVTITNVLDTGLETLDFTSCVGFTVLQGPGPVIELQSVDPSGLSQATFETCLRSVTYNNSSQDPDPTDRTIRFVVNDGDLPSNERDVTVHVIPVNDAPNVAPDAFQTIGNTTLALDTAGPSTPHVAHDPGGAGGIQGVLVNDGPDVEGDTFDVVGIVGCADTTAPFVCTTPGGGTVTMNADGSFLFAPDDGDTTDSFQYIVEDNPTTGTPAQATGTVSLTMVQMVWYVDPNAGAGGNGTSASPFNNADSLDGAGGVGDIDGPGDYLYIHDGTLALSAPLALEASQHLIGQGVALSIPVGLNGNASPTNLAAAGTHPQLNGPAGLGGDAVQATAAVPVEIRGLSLQGSESAIQVLMSGALSGSSTLTIANNIIRGAGAEGIYVDMTATGALDLTISNNSWDIAGTHAGTAFELFKDTTGTLNLAFNNNTNMVSSGSAIVIDGNAPTANMRITSFSGNTIHGNTGGTGVNIADATFDATPGGAVQQVNGGALAIGSGGAPGNPVGGAGMVLNNVTGNLFFTDLDIFAGTSGLTATGAGGFTLGVTDPGAGGSSIISANSGAALNITSATVDLRLASLQSTTTGSGVSLTTVTGQVSASAGSAISKTSGGGTAFNVNGSNVTLTYGGTLNVTSGAGVSLSANSGSTISFSGQLTLNTGANAAFSASSSGTVTVTGANNTLATTTATALNVANTTIGAGGLQFRSISANGAPNGIVLQNTGASGGLTVTGTGTTSGSGGTIQNIPGGDGATTGIGVYLNNTRNVSISNLNLAGPIGNHGIFGTGVRGTTLIDRLVSSGNIGTSNSGIFNESVVSFEDLGGDVTIRNSTLNGGAFNALRVQNTAGTNPVLSSLTIQSNTVTHMQGSTADVRSTALLVTLTDGTADIDILNNTVSFWWGNAIHVLAQGTSSATATISGNQAHQTSGALAGAGGIWVAGGQLTYAISGNSIRYTNGAAISADRVNFGTTMQGTIDGNTIGLSGDANSGSFTGIGIFASHHGPGTTTVKISNNTLRQINGSASGAITTVAGDAVGFGGSGTFNVTIVGNNIQESGTTVNSAQQGILITHGVQSSPPTDTDLGCYDIGGAGALANSITNFNMGSAATAQNRIRVNQRFGTTSRFPGYTGAATGATSETDLASYLLSRNIASNSTNANLSTGGFLNTIPAGSACPQPASP